MHTQFCHQERKSEAKRRGGSRFFRLGGAREYNFVRREKEHASNSRHHGRNRDQARALSEGTAFRSSSKGGERREPISYLSKRGLKSTMSTLGFMRRGTYGGKEKKREHLNLLKSRLGLKHAEVFFV